MKQRHIKTAISFTTAMLFGTYVLVTGVDFKIIKFKFCSFGEL